MHQWMKEIQYWESDLIWLVSLLVHLTIVYVHDYGKS